MGRILDKLTTSACDMVRVLIVGNSIFPSDIIARNLIQSSDKIIACDGAIEKCIERKINADYVIGDMDSLENMTVGELEKLNLQIIKIDDQHLSKSIAIMFAKKFYFLLFCFCWDRVWSMCWVSLAPVSDQCSLFLFASIQHHIILPTEF